MLDQDDIQQLRRLMEAREKRDSDKKALEKSEKEFREAEAELFDKLTDPETGNVRRIPPVDLGPPFGRVAFSARETFYGRIIPGMEKEALDYFRSRGIINEVSHTKFQMSRVNEEVRERLEGAQPMPPGLDWYANRGVTITRQKGDG